MACTASLRDAPWAPHPEPKYALVARHIQHRAPLDLSSREARVPTKGTSPSSVVISVA